MTQRRIREWVDYWHDDVYVSFSGGKDSTVLKHIVDSMYDNIPAVFVNDAGAEWTVWRAHGRKTIKIQLSKVALPA